MTRPMVDYWNHNTTYHAELLAAAPSSGGDVLDIGCGDGLFVKKLAVVGLQPKRGRRVAD
ncbi:MAG: hypothetical protein ACK5LN_14010 [Propioniciclava sp.]